MSQSTPSASPDAHVPDPPGRFQKLLTTALWCVLLLVVLFVVVAKVVMHMPGAIPARAELPVLFAAPRFSLVDQEGHTFSSADLAGKAYVCDFMFTTCGSICPMMTQKMAKLQNETPADVQLVSFTVNPEHDTPAALKEYGSAARANFARWHFLTGTPAQMTATVGEMKLPFEPATDRNSIGHSGKFLLIDGSGNVRGIYESSEDSDMKNLATDSARLASIQKGVK